MFEGTPEQVYGASRRLGIDPTQFGVTHTPFPWAATGLAAIGTGQALMQARKMRQQRAANEQLRRMERGDILKGRKEELGELREEMAGRNIAGSPTQRAAKQRLIDIANEQLTKIRMQAEAEKRARPRFMEQLIETGLPAALAFL